jgi:hypothetical protein
MRRAGWNSYALTAAPAALTARERQRLHGAASARQPLAPEAAAVLYDICGRYRGASGGFQDDAHASTIVTLQPLATIRSTAGAGSRNLRAPVGSTRGNSPTSQPSTAVLQLVPFVCLGLDGGQDDGGGRLPHRNERTLRDIPEAGQRGVARAVAARHGACATVWSNRHPAQ